LDTTTLQGIIAILAVVLPSALAKLKERAKRIGHLHNLKPHVTYL
jgi:hypothetical protein